MTLKNEAARELARLRWKNTTKEERVAELKLVRAKGLKKKRVMRKKGLDVRT